MIKPILTGVWVCAATMGATYVGATWQKPAAAVSADKPDQPGHAPAGDMTPIKTRMISVPVLADGDLRGYVVAQFAFTAPAAAIKNMAVKPDHFVVDEAYQLIFAGELMDFRSFKKQDLLALGRKIAENTNKRLGQRVVEDVMVHELNYVPKEKARAGAR